MKESQLKSIEQLKRGSIVRHRMSGNSYVVDSTYDKFAIAVDTIRVTNPEEWILIEEET